MKPLSKDLALRMLNNPDKDIQDFAKEQYPELVNPMQFVKNFEDILKLAGKTMADIRKPYDKIELIRDVITCNHVFKNNEKRWYPVFYHSPFRFYNSACYYSLSVVSARICFRTSEEVEFVGKVFLQEYKEYNCQ